MKWPAYFSIALSVLAVALILFLLMFGEGLRTEAFLNMSFETMAQSPAALVGIIGLYVLLALVGFPQVLLITATVLTFGSASGALYAWIATMISASVTYLFGKYSGGYWLDKIEAPRVKATMDKLAARGLLAIAAIRVIPTGLPFLVINAGAGAANIPAWKFLLGSGVGIIPKILLVALLGTVAPDKSTMATFWQSLIGFVQSRQPFDYVVLIIAIAVILTVVGIRRRL